MTYGPDTPIYFVGFTERTPTHTLTEAIRIACSRLDIEKLGQKVNIYLSPRTNPVKHGKRYVSQPFGYVMVLLDKDTKEHKYVYFGNRYKEGFTVSENYDHKKGRLPKGMVKRWPK